MIIIPIYDVAKTKYVTCSHEEESQSLLRQCSEYVRQDRKERAMVKHLILWKLKDELTTEEKQKVKEEIKTGLEGLQGKIPGLVEIKVQIEGLASSNADLMLDSTFTDEDALKGYSVHPAHVEVADTKVRPYTQIRLCLDFEL